MRRDIDLVHPKCGPQPIGIDASRVRPGMIVKRAFSGRHKNAPSNFDGVEHMWVTVTYVDGDFVCGEINSQPVYLTDAKLGDIVRFQASEIEEIWKS